MKKNNIIELANVTDDAFYTALGKFVAEYFSTKKETASENKSEKKSKLKEMALTSSFTAAPAYQGTETDYEILNRIVADHPEIRMRSDDEVYTKVKKGVLCCENSCLYMIHKADDDGKTLSEVLDIAISAQMHENGSGLTTAALVMIFRILLLHQGRNHAKVKELLTEIMSKNTVNSITVLAKATEKYTQRKESDMRVMYVESLLAKNDGIRDQFEKEAKAKAA